MYKLKRRFDCEYNGRTMRKGQVLVVVMMILAIGVTVAMAISSRSVTEITVSTTQDESSRALEAAQVGLERFLGQIPFDDSGLPTQGGGDIPEMNASYRVPATSMSGGGTSYTVPWTLNSGDVATIDLPDGSSSYGGLRICWCKADVCTPIAAGPNYMLPKIEATFFYRTAAGQFAKTKPYYGTGQATDGRYRNFVASAGNSNCGIGGGGNYRYHVSINFSDDVGQNIRLPATFATGRRMDYVRVRMMDNGIAGVGMAVQLITPGGATFPAQSSVVESIGTSGDTVQKVRAEVLKYDLPSVFDAAIFSGGDIIK